MSATRFLLMALAMPEAIEGAHQGHADFRVGKRVLATLGYPVSEMTEAPEAGTLT